MSGTNLTNHTSLFCRSIRVACGRLWQAWTIIVRGTVPSHSRKATVCPSQLWNTKISDIVPLCCRVLVKQFRPKRYQSDVTELQVIKILSQNSLQSCRHDSPRYPRRLCREMTGFNQVVRILEVRPLIPSSLSMGRPGKFTSGISL